MNDRVITNGISDSFANRLKGAYSDRSPGKVQWLQDSCTLAKVPWFQEDPPFVFIGSSGCTVREWVDNVKGKGLQVGGDLYSNLLPEWICQCCIDRYLGEQIHVLESSLETLDL